MSHPLVEEGLEMLTEEQCLELLGQASVGRVGLSVRALPVILPVNYAVIEGKITFWSSSGMKLDAAQSRTVVAFEVDDFDADERSGWSVLVVGTAVEVLDEETTNAVRNSGLRPWVQGDRTHVVQISPDFVSGRRIVARPRV